MNSSVPKPRRSFRFGGCAALVAAVLGWCGALAGCNVVGAGSYLITGPEETPALFILPPDKSIVVFIDDRGSVIPRSRLRQQIAAKATDELFIVQEVVPAAIDPIAVARITAREEGSELLPVDEVGRRVGADVIIYASVKEFRLMEDQQVPRPTAEFEIKVIDARTGERLWPGTLEGTSHRLLAQMNYKGFSSISSAEDVDSLMTQLADFAGLRLAQLFYDHEPNPLDAEVSP